MANRGQFRQSTDRTRFIIANNYNQAAGITGAKVDTALHINNVTVTSAHQFGHHRAAIVPDNFDQLDATARMVISWPGSRKLPAPH